MDRNNQRWNVTSAVNDHGMAASKFRLGLGRDAIKPIITPDFIGPEDRRYPTDQEDFTMIGVTLRGESRAYPIIVMTQHEVVDDTFLDQHVAVTF